MERIQELQARKRETEEKLAQILQQLSTLEERTYQYRERLRALGLPPRADLPWDELLQVSASWEKQARELRRKRTMLEELLQQLRSLERKLEALRARREWQGEPVEKVVRSCLQERRQLRQNLSQSEEELRQLRRLQARVRWQMVGAFLLVLPFGGMAVSLGIPFLRGEEWAPLRGLAAAGALFASILLLLFGATRVRLASSVPRRVQEKGKQVADLEVALQRVEERLAQILRDTSLPWSSPEEDRLPREVLSHLEELKKEERSLEKRRTELQHSARKVEADLQATEERVSELEERIQRLLGGKVGQLLLEQERPTQILREAQAFAERMRQAEKELQECMEKRQALEEQLQRTQEAITQIWGEAPIPSEEEIRRAREREQLAERRRWILEDLENLLPEGEEEVPARGDLESLITRAEEEIAVYRHLQEDVEQGPPPAPETRGSLLLEERSRRIRRQRDAAEICLEALSLARSWLDETGDGLPTEDPLQQLEAWQKERNMRLPVLFVPEDEEADLLIHLNERLPETQLIVLTSSPALYEAAHRLGPPWQVIRV